MPDTIARPPVNPETRREADALIARLFLAAGCTPESVRACPPLAAAADLMDDPSFTSALAGMDAIERASLTALSQTPPF